MPFPAPDLSGLWIDTLADPFVNPAKAGRVGHGAVFSAPFFHSLSEGGGGRTIAGVQVTRRHAEAGVAHAPESTVRPVRTPRAGTLPW